MEHPGSTVSSAGSAPGSGANASPASWLSSTWSACTRARSGAGSTGDCYDNAAMETFWATLKRELSWIHGPLIYMNRARLRSALFGYIEIFYNRERAQAGLGHLSPLDYEAALVVA